ncbi:MAG: conjugal transfer protein TraO [gamma proteobacterium symbiont of Lucinoma myriamae]|nr:conjugal transfer protein TraO [gamma proteobacterium symbiont of Lucinoma myriamae]MCU7819522.1 conjugal transfer protein TraO [gamma proteobacterium symbiont of Lucinoma myriamae]MCU7833518.1 conjugal transfer protein TraO [gamma proteobacterium symbiont of Lucinoma myriamae]
MKERLLVMNGQKILQSNSEGKWENQKVGKAKGIKPGIYNIHLATNADKRKSYEGQILHTDKENVYQKVGKQFIKHERKNFDKVIDIGSDKIISYDHGKAVVKNSAQKGQRMSR